MTILLIIFLIMNVVLCGFLLFYLFASLWSTTKNRHPEINALSKILIIIPAFNEEKIIRKTLKSVKAIDYPSHMYRIVVVLDHCTDNTEAVCREEFIAIIRNSDQKAGKGFALKKALLKYKNEFNAFLILDADTTVQSNILGVLNQCIRNGKSVVQFKVDRTNYSENALTLFMALGHFVQDNLFFKGRSRLGLPVFLSGTGFGFKRELVPYFIKDSYSITEDLEISLKMIADNVIPYYTDQSAVSVVQPIEKKNAENQQVRWTSGTKSIIILELKSALRKLFIRPSFNSLDKLLLLATWQRPQLIAASFVGGGVSLIFHFLTSVPIEISLMFFVVMLIEIFYLFSGGFFINQKHQLWNMLFKLPMLIVWYISFKIKALTTSKNKKWIKTRR